MMDVLNKCMQKYMHLHKCIILNKCMYLFIWYFQ